MQVVVTSLETQDIYTLDVLATTPFSEFAAIVAADAGIPVAAMTLIHNNLPIAVSSTRTLAEHGVGENDLLVLTRARLGGPPTASAAAGAPTDNERAMLSAAAEQLRQSLLEDKQKLEFFRQGAPEVAGAVNDAARFAELLPRALEALQRQRGGADEARRREMAALEADPFNPDSQRRIEELIRQEAINSNYEAALEYNPESFGRVHMLYIDVEVNGTKVKAFVDSGAQATIMSPDCAERCAVTRLVDTRFAGVARGVGTAKILGRVHSAQIKIGTMFLPCSFTVMEGKDVDLLLGLDMLKRHQAVLDMGKGTLRIGEVEVPFLGESELPAQAREEPPAPSSAAMSPTPTPPTAAVPPKAESNAAKAEATPGSAQGGGKREADISQLVALGFPREQAQRALDQAGGNVEIAAGLLFS